MVVRGVKGPRCHVGRGSYPRGVRIKRRAWIWGVKSVERARDCGIREEKLLLKGNMYGIARIIDKVPDKC